MSVRGGTIRSARWVGISTQHCGPAGCSTTGRSDGCNRHRTIRPRPAADETVETLCHAAAAAAAAAAHLQSVLQPSWRHYKSAIDTLRALGHCVLLQQSRSTRVTSLGVMILASIASYWRLWCHCLWICCYFDYLVVFFCNFWQITNLILMTAYACFLYTVCSVLLFELHY